MKDQENPGKPRNLHFIRHFVRLILPRVRELVPGLTICLYEQGGRGVETEGQSQLFEPEKREGS